MTTLELIKRGVGHNCLSDAYDLGFADAMELLSGTSVAYSFLNDEKHKAYEQGKADAIEEYRPKLLAFICKKYNIPLIDMNCTVDEFDQMQKGAENES